MDKSVRLGPGIAKIGLIKRDMTKLGAGREVGVIWRDEWVALWRHGQPTPEGYEPQQRLVKQRIPKCPTCGCTVMQEKKGQYVHYSLAEDNLLAKLHSFLTTFCPVGGPIKRESKRAAKAKK